MRKNTTNAARSEFSRVAAFILSVCLDSVAIDALVSELRPIGCSARDRKSFDALGGAEGSDGQELGGVSPLALAVGSLVTVVTGLAFYYTEHMMD